MSGIAPPLPTYTWKALAKRKRLNNFFVLLNAMHVHVGSGVAIPDMLLMALGIGRNFRCFWAALEVLLWKTLPNLSFINLERKRKNLEWERWMDEQSICSSLVVRCCSSSPFTVPFHSPSSTTYSYLSPSLVISIKILVFFFFFELKKNLYI